MNKEDFIPVNLLNIENCATRYSHYLFLLNNKFNSIEREIVSLVKNTTNILSSSVIVELKEKMEITDIFIQKKVSESWEINAFILVNSTLKFDMKIYYKIMSEKIREQL